MSLGKLWSALKGGVNEATEAVIDTQAIRILDQELREAKQELIVCDQSLAKIMGKRKLVANKVASLRTEIAKYSDHAVAAHEQGDDSLALECAERVSELEGQLHTEQEILDSYQVSEDSLKANISKARANVRRLEQQIDQVKATESVQKAQVAVSSRHVGANSKVKTALDSLDRIKSRQAQRGAELDAARELADDESGASLDARLRSAGITAGGVTAKNDKLAQILAAKRT